MGGRLFSDFPVTREGRPAPTCAICRGKDAYVTCGSARRRAPFFRLIGRPPRVPGLRPPGRVFNADLEPFRVDLRGTLPIGEGPRIAPSPSGRRFVLVNDLVDPRLSIGGEVALTVEEP